MERAAHHNHRNLRPSSAALRQKVPAHAASRPRAPPGGRFAGAPRFPPAPMNTIGTRSSKFTTEFLGRGFYRDTTMAGVRRAEARKKMDEERARKRPGVKPYQKSSAASNTVLVNDAEGRTTDEQAATTVQAHVRGLRARRQVASIRLSRYESDPKHCKVIQAHVRGHLARRKVAKIRYEAFEERHVEEGYSDNDKSTVNSKPRRMARGRMKTARGRRSASVGARKKVLSAGSKVSEFLIKKKEEALHKKLWIPSSYSPRISSPRPVTAPSRGCTASGAAGFSPPKGFERTGGGFAKVSDKRVLNNEEKGNVQRPKSSRRRARGSCLNSRAASEVSHYAKKRKLAAERAILMRIQRELSVLTKYKKDQHKLQAKATEITRKILIKQIKQKKMTEDEWAERIRLAELEKQRRIKIAKEVAQPSRMPLVSILDDELEKKTMGSEPPIKLLQSEFVPARRIRAKKTRKFLSTAADLIDKGDVNRGKDKVPVVMPPKLEPYNLISVDFAIASSRVDQRQPYADENSVSYGNIKEPVDQSKERNKIVASKTQQLIAEVDDKLRLNAQRREEVEDYIDKKPEVFAPGTCRAVLDNITNAAEESGVSVLISSSDPTGTTTNEDRNAPNLVASISAEDSRVSIAKTTGMDDSTENDYGDDDFEEDYEAGYDDDDFEEEDFETVPLPSVPKVEQGDTGGNEDHQESDEDGWDCNCGMTNSNDDNQCVLCEAYRD